ncbi:MAG: methyltransferase type 11 [Actinobacteria bacterium]|nr:methyltransferase type 11 [Actinomycetota bacterium]
MRRRALFLRSMISHPRRVGAVWPTSRWAVRDLLDMGNLPGAINDSAAHVYDYLEGTKADYIVSSVPFTSLPADVRRSLLEAARGALAPNGQMLVLQYSTTVLQDLERVFATIRRRFSPLNIPPAFLFACSTSEAPNGRIEEASQPDGAGRMPYVLSSLALGALLLLLLGRRLGRRR